MLQRWRVGAPVKLSAVWMECSREEMWDWIVEVVVTMAGRLER